MAWQGENKMSIVIIKHIDHDIGVYHSLKKNTWSMFYALIFYHFEHVKYTHMTYIIHVWYCGLFFETEISLIVFFVKWRIIVFYSSSISTRYWLNISNAKWVSQLICHLVNVRLNDGRSSDLCQVKYCQIK